MRENSIKISLEEKKSDTWKFSDAELRTSSPSALIINPFSLLGETTLKKLTENNLLVFIPPPDETTPVPSINFSEGSMVKILPKGFEGRFPDQLLYLIFFVASPDDLANFSQNVANLPIETRKVVVMPFEFGVGKIIQFSSEAKEKIVVVPPGFTVFPDNAEQYIYFKIISALVTNTSLSLNPNDSSNLAVASFEELSTAILNVLFTGPKRSIHWLIPNPLNLVTSLALIQNCLPLESRSQVALHLGAPLYNQQIILPENTSYWAPSLPVDKTIRDTLEKAKNYSVGFRAPYLSAAPTGSRGKVEVKKTNEGLSQVTKPAEKKPLHLIIIKVIRKVFKILIIILGIFAVAVLVYLILTLWEIYHSFKLASANPSRSTEALQSAKNALRNITFVDQATVLLKDPLSVIGLDRFYLHLSSQIASFETFSYTEISMLRLYRDLQTAFASNDVTSQDEQLIHSDLSEAVNNLTLTHLALSSDASWLKKLPFLGQKVETGDNLLASIRSSLVDGQEILPFLTALKAPDQFKKYLILFQNNMELRPTGGFVGSYGLLTTTSGKITGFEVKDVYAADGQLKGHVEPPSPIKNVLGEAGWKLRDSNWDPDFPTTAARAQWFLEKETGEVVDGTIGVTLKLAQNILDATGPVTLEDYQEVISKDNLFEKAQSHSEINFFPGSTQKKDFLGGLAQAVLGKLKEPTPSQLVKLLTAFNQASKERDLQIYFNDPKLEEAITKISLAGEVDYPKDCSTPNCVQDYLFPVDSNLGVNKANFAIEKKYLDRISLKPNGDISHLLTVIFLNKAKSESWPLGRYKSYFRLYLPAGSSISGVNTKDPRSGQVVKISKLDHSEEHGFEVVGFSFEVPIQQSREVEISYRISSLIEPLKDGVYLLSLRKQGGTNDDPFEIVFDAPPGILLIPSSPNSDVKSKTFDLSNTVRYNFFLSSDKALRIEVHPKI